MTNSKTIVITGSSKGIGPGLGLTVAYSNIQSHQGEISAKNSDYEVTFNIKLPLQCN